MFQGDCNTTVSLMVKRIPRGALTLAFLDPEALDVRFETVSTLASAGRVDLLVLFADAYDVVRNVDRYEAEMGSKLDQMLGSKSNWREAWSKIQNRTGPNVREFFSALYVEQLRNHLGYLQFGVQPIESARGPLYKLIYASKDPRGLDFWQKATSKDKGGQGNLF